MSESCEHSMEMNNIICICGCHDDKFYDSVRCISCSLFQHKSCYNLRRNEEINHLCIDCENRNKGNKCSAYEIITNIMNKKTEALYRRALLLCLKETRVSVSTIMSHLKINRKKAMSIHKKLDSDGCFFLSSSRNGKQVDTDHLKRNVAHRYFADPLFYNCYENEDEDDDVQIVYWSKRIEKQVEDDDVQIIYWGKKIEKEDEDEEFTHSSQSSKPSMTETNEMSCDE